MWPWSKRAPQSEIDLYARLEAKLERVTQALEAKIERGSTVALRADLDNLSGRLESFAASTSKQLGKLWQRERAPLERAPDGRIERPGSTGDPDLDEQLAIQAEWAARASGERH